MDKNYKIINLNDLPKYSVWPEKLISKNNSILHAKNSEAVYREYEIDKWSKLLAKIEKNDCNLDKIDMLQFSSLDPIAFSLKDTLYLVPPLVTREKLASIIADKVKQLRSNNEPIVELGAGTGVIIARLAKDKRFSEAVFYAGDFSPSSLKIIQHLAKIENIRVETGFYDFNTMKADLIIPKDSVIFISFALAYMSKIDPIFWERLMQAKPRAILVAEPIYSFFRDGTLLGLLRKRYYEANDYNRDIFGSMQDAQQKGILKIGDIEENIIGINPLCPVSMITLYPIISDQT